ncbi:chemotaxis protein CheB [Rhodanobacter sp. DHG33]|uniref:chemotaxis protein CheB n=1 Tax=Rhodanobacter sp. DHG33 TaxID=2775921 RepID=UPI001782C65E|nr:chemotaxis protein CheB [Rhodanobacter sp. DHG33]MBD8898034.1 chemotaxis protein CheB [Rhodanobacter sp. DHG33]
MAEALPAVALLFDDAALGSHLREALQERGARIVHEGNVAGFDSALLRQLDPDVLVVNLDEDDDESFERLFGMIEGERPRLVLNDARASHALAGWDRARWARHLAMKVLASGDVDPPRPADALAVETVPTVAAQVAEPVAAFSPEAGSDMPLSDDHPDHAAEEPAAQTLAASNDLEAELAALLAEPAPADPSGAELAAHSGPGDESVAHHLEVSAGLEAELAALLAKDESLLPEEEPAPVAVRDELPLHDGDFSFALHTGDEHAAAQTAPPPVRAETAKAPSVPDSWALVDHDAAAHENAEPEEAANFGVQKLSAADFLAPDVEPAEAEFQPTMSLELVSMEEAVAPRAWEQQSSNEMLLDDLGNALSRVVLLGAAVDGLDSVCAFLASLPASAGHTILLTQHFGTQPAEAVLERLSNHSSLPIQLAKHGSRARRGEVLLVPASGQVQLRRDGRVELREHGEDREPSIDTSFTMAANAFGRDALGIVFAGRSTDAVAGSQAIHDRGGQVWVESANGEHYADMVSGIFAERLVSYSGTLHELAAHLIEVYP